MSLATLRNELPKLNQRQLQTLDSKGFTCRADLEDLLISNANGRDLISRLLQVSLDSIREIVGWQEWPQPQPVMAASRYPLGGVIAVTGSAQRALTPSDRLPRVQTPNTDHVCLAQKYRPARQQGGVGACVSFAITSIAEGQAPEPIDLAPAFVYSHMKQLDGMPNTDGSHLIFGLAALCQYGVCPEPDFPYRENRDYLRSTPPADAYQHARRFMPEPGSEWLLPPRDVSLMQTMLHRQLPVAIAVPIFESTRHSLLFASQGRFLMQLGDDDQPIGFHAMCLVGWFTNSWLATQGISDQPGGGVFLVRNSWGTEWARDNPVSKVLNSGGGYALMPFAYLAEYNIEACTVPIPVVDTQFRPARDTWAARWLSRIANRLVAESHSRLISGLTQPK